MPAGRLIISLFFIAIHSLVYSQYITYRSDVKPILEKHCVGCHQPGEVGPMPLTNYEEVSAYGKMIAFVTSTKLMPPWYADPSYRHFKNERVLSEAEIKTIADWVEGDMKEGALPYGMAISNTAGVTVYPRDPDLVLSMEKSFEQFGVYMDQYQAFVIPTNLSEDKWVEAIEFVPGNKKIVRHASISVSPHATFDSLDRWDPRYGYFSFGGIGKTSEQPFWYTWSPQQGASYFTKGNAKFLPRGSDLIVHIHYGPTGTPLPDSSSVNLHFSQDTLHQRIITAPLINPYTLTNDSFYIKANQKEIFHASYTLPYSISLNNLTPQANLLCRSWEVFAEVPGDTVPLKLLKIKDWNINWKQTYHFNNPIFLPKGTVIHSLTHYDNTIDNPCNPSDKPRDVQWGAHLFSELLFVHFEFTLEPLSLTAPEMLVTPILSSEEIIPVSLEVYDKGIYRIEIDNEEDKTKPVVMTVPLLPGKQSLYLNIRDLPFGNYAVQVYDEKEKLLAVAPFIRMREKGL